MTGLYPATDLYPGSTLFPGAPVPILTDGGYYALIEASIADLILTAADEFGCQWVLTGLDGWEGGPGSTLDSTLKGRAPGAWPGPRQFEPRDILATGLLHAPSVGVLRDARDRLKAAASIDARLFTVAEDGLTRSCSVYREDKIGFDRETPTDATWSIPLVALDPRQFGAPLAQTTGLPSGSGGITIPLTVPLVVSSTTVTGAASLTNAGNVAGPVVVRIDGPVAEPRITHQETGRVWSSSITLAADEYLIVDMEAQSALLMGQASRNGLITSRQWLSFLPGANTYLVDSAGFNPASMFTITATPSWA